MKTEFSCAKPAVGTFVGRDNVLADIDVRLHRGESIALRTSRCMGKTSLLARIRARIESRLEQSPLGPNLLPCLIDARDLSRDSARRLCADLSRHCLERMMALSKLELPVDLKAASVLLQQRLDWTPVLLIDNADALQRVVGYEDILDYFSGLAFPSQFSGPICQFVFTGGFRLWNHFNGESTSPLAIRTTWMILGGLDIPSEPGLMRFGYTIPIVYQFLRSHAVTSRERADRKRDLLQRFATDARPVLTSWWQSLGREGQHCVVCAAQNHPDDRAHTNHLETLDRLFGTGLTSTRGSSLIRSTELCALLAKAGSSLATEAPATIQHVDVAREGQRALPVLTPVRRSNIRHEVFISHASEDKDSIARPLYLALVARGITVWFDEAILELGDSLRRKIDEGLVNCQYGVVLLSPHFLAKHWPQHELDGLINRETVSGDKAILPIWHNIDRPTLATHSPLLADRIAACSDEGPETLAEKIMQIVRRRPATPG